MTFCDEWLWNLGTKRVGTVQPCECVEGCPWVWERRERGFWSRMLFWRRTVPEIGGGVWVRLGVAASAFIRAEEHAGLVAADQRERG